MFERLLHRIEQKLFDHDSIGSRAVRLLLRVLRYPYAIAHDIWRGELTLRAMSLVYTTLLSIVPLLAVSFSVLKGLGYHREIEPLLFQFLEPMGDRGYQLTSEIMRFVENARGDVLGSLGVAFLLYTSFSMIQKVEEAFNRVWRVQEPREFGRRITEYLSVLMVGPALIIPALGLMGTLTSNNVVKAIAAIEPFGTMLLWFGKATPYILVTCVFTFVYGFIPNTKVQLRAALIGGVVASILWVGSGALFASFVSGANSAVLIYAGFAIVILALIWLHISWLILLIGAQLAYYVQHPHSLRPGSTTQLLTPSLCERLALSVMYLLGSDFTKAADASENNPDRGAKHFTLNRLADQLHVPVSFVGPVVQRLEAAGLILVTEDDRLVPGRDLAHIELIDILEAVRHDNDVRGLRIAKFVGEAESIAKAARDAMRSSLQQRTLAQLINTNDSRGAVDARVAMQSNAAGDSQSAPDA